MNIDEEIGTRSHPVGLIGQSTNLLGMDLFEYILMSPARNTYVRGLGPLVNKLSQVKEHIKNTLIWNPAFHGFWFDSEIAKDQESHAD